MLVEPSRPSPVIILPSQILDAIPINRSLPRRKVNPAEAISFQLTVHTVHLLALEMFPGFKGFNRYWRGYGNENVNRAKSQNDMIFARNDIQEPDESANGGFARRTSGANKITLCFRIHCYNIGILRAFSTLFPRIPLKLRC